MDNYGQLMKTGLMLGFSFCTNQLSLNTICSKMINKQLREVYNIKTNRVKDKYNKIANYYDLVDNFIPNELRRKALAGATGRVLEVGIGTGSNLKYYPAECNITGIDLSENMLKKAKDKASSLGLNIELCEMDIEKLQFNDETFDTVVATCVFCTVPNPVAGLLELKRVCKRGGRLIFLEHVRSRNKFWGGVMDLINPISVSLVGCNINRQTVSNIKRAGLNIQSEEGNIFKYITTARN